MLPILNLLKFKLLQVTLAIEGGETSAPGGGIKNPLEGLDTLEQVLNAIADFLFTISIPIVVIIIIVGAFQFLTAGGNEEKIRKGKRTITWAVIGFAVILISGSIAELIKNLLS